MSNLKEDIKKLIDDGKALLQRFNEQKPEAKVEFSEVTLKDGTICKYEGELNAGTALTVMQPGGGEVPAPDGTHELEDGTLVTTEGGVVMDIKKPGEEPAAEVVVNAETMAAIAKAVEEAKAEITAKYEAMFSEKFAAITEGQKELADLVGRTAEAMTELANESPETKEEKKSFASMIGEKKGSALDNLMSAAGKYKQKTQPTQ